MKEVILHLGSNIHERTYFLNLAKKLIQKEIGVIKVSSKLYETEAWGLKDQSDFLNLAHIVETILSPSQVLEKVKAIEDQIGREEVTRWGPRCIDIDILFYENQIVETEKLTIPHPMLENRNFVLIPLLEIAGDYIHPVFNKSIEELYIESTDECEVWIYENKNI